MGSKAEILNQLRLLPGIKQLKPKSGGFEAPGLPFRIPRGAVVELTGSAPTEFVVEFLVLNRHFVVFWCEKDQRVFPPYIDQRGFDVTSVTFGTYGEYLPNAVGELLRSTLYDVIVTPSDFSDIAVDRFGRLSREHDSILLMLATQNPSDSIHIDLQLEIHRGDTEGSFRHDILKFKYGRL